MNASWHYASAASIERYSMALLSILNGPVRPKKVNRMLIYHGFASKPARAWYRLIVPWLAFLLLVPMTTSTHAQQSTHLVMEYLDLNISYASAGTHGSEARTDGATSGAYTTAQAERGLGLYQEHCQSCHSRDMGGSSPFPPITGQNFFSDWSDRSISDLQQYIRDNMPLGTAGSLSDQVYADITAYWLSRHGYPAGNQPLPEDPANSPDLPIEDRRD